MIELISMSILTTIAANSGGKLAAWCNWLVRVILLSSAAPIHWPVQVIKQMA